MGQALHGWASVVMGPVLPSGETGGVRGAGMALGAPGRRGRASAGPKPEGDMWGAGAKRGPAGGGTGGPRGVHGVDLSEQELDLVPVCGCGM